MKKILYILIALGLVLGLSVMATPLSAACPNSPQACTVTVSPDVECEVACYTVNFTTSSVGGLAIGDTIVITFPSTSVITGANVTLSPGGVVTPAVVGYELHIPVAAAINASSKVSVVVCNVSNPVAGTYTLLTRTTWDYCDCSSSFTIKAGGSISPTTAVWCINSSKNVTTTITWGGSTSVKNVTVSNGTAVLFGVAADNKTLMIDSANLSVLGLQPCSVTKFLIDFAPGCNKTLEVTAADSFALTLQPGWNLISLPLIPLSTAIGDVLKDIDSKVSSVWYWDGCASKWLVYKNGTGFTSLTTMDTCKSYWVCSNASANVTLTVCGYQFPCPPGAPPCCCYCDCWNMAGFNSKVTRNMTAYTANLSPAGSLVGVVTWTQTGGWSTLTGASDMNPGQGYFMAFTTDACIVPPV